MLASGLIRSIVGSPGGSEGTVWMYSACPSLMISRFFANDSHLDLPQAAPRAAPQANLKPTSSQPKAAPQANLQIPKASPLHTVCGAFFSDP